MPARRDLITWAMAAAVDPAAAAGPAAAPAGDWAAWNLFYAGFVQADGRVIDLTDERKSTSEGQSYALFFALVANQRKRFDTLLAWTSDNLAAGRLGERLPAWWWGRRDDGSWGVKDPNSASDADLWIAYALFEAARLWQEPRYAATGRQLLAQVSRHEVAQAGSFGPVLLPGAFGFVLPRQRWRFNPSYVPGFMFRYFARVDPQGPWHAIWDGYLRLAPQLFSAGIAPDNVVVDATGRVFPDTEREPSASYDGIRVYLWAGMSGDGSRALVQRLAPFAALTRRLGHPPEKVDPATGLAIASSYSPIGFSAALLPLLSALDERATLQLQRERVRAALASPGGVAAYYDQMLVLFGLGWLEGRFRFDDQGRLLTPWAPP